MDLPGRWLNPEYSECSFCCSAAPVVGKLRVAKKSAFRCLAGFGPLVRRLNAFLVEEMATPEQTRAREAFNTPEMRAELAGIKDEADQREAEAAEAAIEAAMEAARQRQQEQQAAAAQGEVWGGRNRRCTASSEFAGAKVSGAWRQLALCTLHLGLARLACLLRNALLHVLRCNAGPAEG